MNPMEFTKEDLANLSTLARISIAPEEEEKMLHDMRAILGYVSEINAVPREAYSQSGEVEGESRRGEETVYNVVREDVVTRMTGSNTEALLAEAPLVKDGYVQVAQVLK